MESSYICSRKKELIPSSHGIKVYSIKFQHQKSLSVKFPIVRSQFKNIDKL